MGTIIDRCKEGIKAGSRRKLSTLARKISEHKLRLLCFTILFYKSAWTHEGHTGALLAGVCLPRGHPGHTCGVELVEFCSPPACSTVCLAELQVVAALPSLWEALQLLPFRDHPLLLWPTCPPLTLFVLPALCSHTGGPSSWHPEASSWFRAPPALLCLPRGRGDTLVLGKLSVPADGHGVGGPRALEPAWHEERTLSSLLAEGLCS